LKFLIFYTHIGIIIIKKEIKTKIFFKFKNFVRKYYYLRKDIKLLKIIIIIHQKKKNQKFPSVSISIFIKLLIMNIKKKHNSECVLLSQIQQERERENLKNFFYKIFFNDYYYEFIYEFNNYICIHFYFHFSFIL
jgi:hypothetical protein